MQRLTRSLIALLVLAAISGCDALSAEAARLGGTYTGTIDNGGTRTDVALSLPDAEPGDTFSLSATLTCRAGCDGDSPLDVPQSFQIDGAMFDPPVLRFPDGLPDWRVSADRRTITIVTGDGTSYDVTRR